MSTRAPTSSNTNKPEIGFAGVALVGLPALLQILAVLLMGAYAAGAQASYTEPVSWAPMVSSLVHGRWKLEPTPMDYLLFGASSIGLLLTIASRSNSRSLLRLIYFAAQLLVFGFGCAGIVLIITLPVEIWRIDGEWFGEETPRRIALGSWLLVSVWMALRAIKARFPSLPVTRA